MNRRSRKKNAILYFRQGILSLVLLGLTMYLFMHASLFQTLFPASTDSFEELANLDLNEDSPNYKIKCKKLYYTGYDNYTQKKVTGHYYYAIQDNYCLFFLLGNTKEEPEQVLDNYEGVFHIIKDNNTYNQLTSNLAKELDWSSNSLRGMCLPFIASQPDHHTLPTNLLVLTLLACTVVFLLSAINNFSHYYRMKHFRPKSTDRNTTLTSKHP